MWKEAITVAVYKKGDPECPSKYRLLPSNCGWKMLLIKIKIQHHITDLNKNKFYQKPKQVLKRVIQEQTLYFLCMLLLKNIIVNLAKYTFVNLKRAYDCV